MTLLEILHSAGFIGLFLMGLGILVIYLISRNLFFFLWMENHAKKKEGLKTPLHLIMQEIQKKPSLSMQAKRGEISHLFHRYLGRVLRDASVLRLISVISPLLGLMGTVLGIMNVFQVMAQTPNADPAQFLAGGIQQALITTIWGLAVAVPALISYYLGNLYLKRLAWRVLDETMKSEDAS